MPPASGRKGAPNREETETMNRRFFGRIAGPITLAGAVGLLAAPVQATEGYFSQGYGAINKSMAGAGVATGFDAMVQVTNPAGLILVDPQFTGDLSLFSPRRESTVTGAPGFNDGNHESGKDYFLVPSLAAGAYSIDDSSAWGWAVYGNGGMNTSYPGPSPFGPGRAGIDLAQLFFQGTYSREITSAVSIGIGPILAAQRFQAYGISAFGFASSDPTKLTDNGYDYSYGFGGRLGVQAELTPALRFGASYQSRMYMSEFDNYAGLFAEQGDFDIPPALQAGFSFEPASGVTLALDWKRIWYSQINSVGNPITSLGPLGADNGVGFGWEDIDAVKLGVSWEVNPTITLRAGIALNDNPIPASEVTFNILAPGVQEQHYTAGLGWKVNANNLINFGAMYSPSNSVSGSIPAGFGGGTAEIEMYQWEATVGWTRTF